LVFFYVFSLFFSSCNFWVCSVLLMHRVTFHKYIILTYQKKYILVLHYQADIKFIHIICLSLYFHHFKHQYFMTIISINKKTAEEQQYDVPRRSERNFKQSI